VSPGGRPVSSAEAGERAGITERMKRKSSAVESRVGPDDIKAASCLLRDRWVMYRNPEYTTPAPHNTTSREQPAPCVP